MPLRSHLCPAGSGQPLILLVDDDDVTMMAMSGGLRSLGYRTMEASCGRQALQRLSSARPDLAIVDINMPEMSGMELARRLLELGPIPFLFLSSDDRAECVNEANMKGAVAYLVKPLSVKQMMPAIQFGLARSAELRALRQQQSVLAEALDAARDTNQAVGVLMERMRVDRQQAFDVLRRQARSDRRKVRAVAADMLNAAPC